MKKVLNILLVLLIFGLYIYFEYGQTEPKKEVTYIPNDIPLYSGKDTIILNDNEPIFDLDSVTNKSFEEYGRLDELGRCTYAYANIGVDLMPTKDRDRISEIKPTAWHYVKYDFIEDE